MSDELIDEFQEEKVITIPAFLTSKYAVSTAAACQYWLCTGCEAEQGDPCGTGEWCSQCSCQGWECGCQYDECTCEGGQGCKESSCGDEMSACGMCDPGVMGGCAGQGGSCSQSCSECGGCEGCMDCENSCQNAIQSQIDLWDWYKNDATTAAYNAITKHGAVGDFSRNVWNDLVDRVYDVRGLASVSPRWDTTYETYYSTRMNADDSVLTAVRFNSLLKNIDTLKNVTNVAIQYRGNPVVGSYFTSLTTALNNYIASL